MCVCVSHIGSISIFLWFIGSAESKTSHISKINHSLNASSTFLLSHSQWLTMPPLPHISLSGVKNSEHKYKWTGNRSLIREEELLALKWTLIP